MSTASGAASGTVDAPEFLAFEPVAHAPGVSMRNVRVDTDLGTSEVDRAFAVVEITEQVVSAGMEERPVAAVDQIDDRLVTEPSSTSGGLAGSNVWATRA